MAGPPNAKIRHLTLIVTDDCNFSCGYCYKDRRRASMTLATASLAVRTFRPRLKRGFVLNFYGGEPLLRFSLIRRLVAWIDGQPEIRSLRPRFAVSTNGSLLSPGTLDFLEKCKFFVELSFDGLGQDVHRKPGSFLRLAMALKDLLARPAIRFEVNAVFSPKTVPLLADSVRFLADSGAGDIRISIALNQRWTRKSIEGLGSQLSEVRHRMAGEFRRRGVIPVANFRETMNRGNRVFACGAGLDRLAVSPEGEIWGCHLFPDLFRLGGRPPEIGAFRFGRLSDSSALGRDYRSVLGRHEVLEPDGFSVSGRWCLFCPDRDDCEICPLHSAFAGARIGAIPPHICAIQRLWIAERRALAAALARPAFRSVANRRENG